MKSSIKNILAFLCVMALLVLTGCSNKKSPTRKQFFVKGDPISLISQTTKNPVTSFNKTNYRSFSEYSLLTIVSFEEKEISSLNNNISLEDLENENAATSERETSTSYPFTFKQINSSFVLSGSAFNTQFRFPFKENSNGFFVFDESTYNSFSNTVALETKLEHFSITPDKRIFSLLLSQKTQAYGRILVSFYFVKDQEVKSMRENISSFFYTNVYNALLGWDQSKTVELNICHKKNTVHIEGLINNPTINEDVIKSWDLSLKGRLNVSYKWLRDWKPFSDLNQNCIIFNEDLLVREEKDALNGGVNFSIPDFTTNQIITSDIIIWAKEISKEFDFYKNLGWDPNNPNVINFQESLNSFLIHEIGHFFQLDHQFDGTPTVMSYSHDRIGGLYKYDFEAIEHLYPLISVDIPLATAAVDTTNTPR